MGVKALRSSGRYDPAVSVDHPERLRAMLERAGAEVTLEWQEGGHALEPAEIAVAHQWLARQGWA
jgi:predicted esterase